MKKIIARLMDIDGYTITECECDTKKEAKDRCKYYLTDSYAQQAETTHKQLKTEKAEILIDEECEWDMFI